MSAGCASGQAVMVASVYISCLSCVCVCSDADLDLGTVSYGEQHTLDYCMYALQDVTNPGATAGLTAWFNSLYIGSFVCEYNV